VRNEKGQSVIEYVLMMAAVAAIVVATLPYIKGILWGPEDPAILHKTRENLSAEHLQNGNWE
jgi:acetylornithine deacetylase/succinyl-diaminopimelate desuccinylase-like protein